MPLTVSIVFVCLLLSCCVLYASVEFCTHEDVNGSITKTIGSDIDAFSLMACSIPEFAM